MGLSVADITPRVTRDKSVLWSRADEEDTAEKRHDVESRAGVGDVLALTQRRHDLVREAAPLRALRDTFDARRKAERGKVLVLLNADRAERKESPVAATLAETVASGDPRYTDFLDAAALAFAHLAIIEDEVQAITDILHRDQALLRYAANEPRG